MNISENIKRIRELKKFSQEYMAHKLEISQSSYAKLENGQISPKVDRLERIAEILEVDLSTLLNTTNNFSFTFNSEANQSGYINHQHNMNMDIQMLRKIIREEIDKSKE